MANQAYATVNDYEISWSSIMVKLSVNDGVTLDVNDIEGIKFGSTLETGLTYGTSGGRPMKETEGKVKFTGSMMLTKSGIYVLKTALMAVAPTRGNDKLIGAVRFSVQVLHRTVSNPNFIYETLLEGCRYRGESEDNKEGVDGLINEIPIDPLNIVQIINGQRCSLL